MEVALWLGILIAGSIAVTLILRWAMRKLAFRLMRFEVRVRGKTFVYHRDRFFDANGREVVDPALLAELREAWKGIELSTAMSVRH